MKKKLRILFVGAGKRYSVAERLIHAGREMDLDIEIYAYESGVQVPIADIATVIQGKDFSAADVLSDLEFVIRQFFIDIALPYHDKAIPLLAKLAHITFVPTCHREKVEIFGSKIQSADFFRHNLIPPPPFSRKVPAIAKPDFGSASQGLLRFADQSQLDAFLHEPDRVLYEVQDLVSGPEYSVDGYIALNSKFCYFAVRERLEVLGGESVRSQTVEIPAIEEFCHSLAKIDGVRGAITFQFIFDKRHDGYNIMEVNSRFGGGMLTSMGAGVPWFHILLRDFLRLPQPGIKHKSGVLMVRSFREHFFNI